MRRTRLLGLAAAAVLATASIAAAAAVRWSLDLSHDAPTWVTITGAGGKPAVAWYVKYNVTNGTDETVKPAVRIEFRTDTGKTYRDGGDPRVVTAVAKKLKNDKIKTSWDLRKGVAKDASVDCVAALGEVDNMAKAGELRFYGLQDPIDTINGKKFNEIKYWSVQYTRRGDEFKRTEDPWMQKGEGKWVVESREELPAKEK